MSEQRSMEADVVSMVMTPAVKEELHKALDNLCNDLQSAGKLGSTVHFTLCPDGSTPDEGDSLAVTMQLMLLPMLDGQPCGYFLPQPEGNGVVH